MFIFAVIVGILALIAWGISFVVARELPTGEHPRKYVRVGALCGALLCGLLIFISSLTIVSTKNIGVVVSFGKPAGELSAGLHLIAPWQSVTEMDAAIQTDSYAGKDCLNVRIANQQTACVDISLRWRIRPDAADYLFQNYRTFENVRDSLVTRELTAAINYALSSYNPLNSIGGAANTNPTLAQIAGQVTAKMQREIGSHIEVLNTIIPIISFDPATQNRLNQLQQQIAQSRIAQQEIQTNQAQSQANQALAQSVSNDPNVLVSKCLDILNTMVKDGQKVPAGFSCWPGGNLAGVIANASGG